MMVEQNAETFDEIIVTDDEEDEAEVTKYKNLMKIL